MLPIFLRPWHLKTTANRLLILPATQANVTRHAGLEFKKILRSPFGKQLEKYSRQMPIFTYLPVTLQNTTWILCLCLNYGIVWATVWNSFFFWYPGIYSLRKCTHWLLTIIKNDIEFLSRNPLCISFSWLLFLLGIPQNNLRIKLHATNNTSVYLSKFNQNKHMSFKPFKIDSNT